MKIYTVVLVLAACAPPAPATAPPAEPARELPVADEQAVEVDAGTSDTFCRDKYETAKVDAGARERSFLWQEYKDCRKHHP